jgi:hypothetical protein
MDGHGYFDQFVKEIEAITEVGTLTKRQAWNQVEALAQVFIQMPPLPPPSGGDRLLYTFQRLAARLLVETRKTKGEAAATQLAEIYSSLPTLWK